jgi:copper(I)-binding protein
LVLTLMLMIALGATGSSGASNAAKVVISHATVTTAKKGRSSAISFELSNTTKAEIWLTFVSSPLSPSDMIDYDKNMTVKSSHMIVEPFITVLAGHSVTLSFRGQGAMLGSISKNFKVRTMIPLTLGWHSKAHPLTTLVAFSALVVKPARKIYFGSMSNGSTSGMSMGSVSMSGGSRCTPDFVTANAAVVVHPRRCATAFSLVP